MIVVDQISGIQTLATLRWRLPADEWLLGEDRLMSGKLEIRISSDTTSVDLKLVDGWESRYYLQKERLQVLEATIFEPATVTTECYWQAR